MNPELYLLFCLYGWTGGFPCRKPVAGSANVLQHTGTLTTSNKTCIDTILYQERLHISYKLQIYKIVKLGFDFGLVFGCGCMIKLGLCSRYTSVVSGEHIKDFYKNKCIEDTQRTSLKIAELNPFEKDSPETTNLIMKSKKCLISFGYAP